MFASDGTLRRKRRGSGKDAEELTNPIGKLPDCRMSFCKGFSQGGSNADIVIADAYIKNLTEGIDWETAYEAVLSDAEGKVSLYPAVREQTH